MGDGIIAILQFGLLTFLSSVAAGVVITVCAQLYASVIRQKGREQELRDKIATYSRLVTGLQDRVEGRKAQAAGAASQLFGAQRQEKQLKTRLRDLEKEPHRFVRMIGVEQLPNRPFEILAVNTSVAHQVKRGERHPFYDSAWARPVPVHIWAKSVEEAKEEFERIYPRSTGFKLLEIQALSANGPGKPAAGAMAAAAMAATDGDAGAADGGKGEPGKGRASGGSALGVTAMIPPLKAAQPAEVGL